METTMEQLLEALRLAGEALIRYETYEDLNLTDDVMNKVRGKNLGLALDIAVTRHVLTKMYVTAHLEGVSGTKTGGK